MTKLSFVPEFIYRATPYGSVSPWATKQEHIDVFLNQTYSADAALKSELEEVHKNPADVISILRHEGKFPIATGTIYTRKPKPPRGMRYEGRMVSREKVLKEIKRMRDNTRFDFDECPDGVEDDYVYIAYTFYYVSHEEKLRTEFNREEQREAYSKLILLNKIKRLAKNVLESDKINGKQSHPADVYNAGLDIPTLKAGTSVFNVPLDYYGNSYNFSYFDEEDRDNYDQE